MKKELFLVFFLATTTQEAVAADNTTCLESVQQESGELAKESVPAGFEQLVKPNRQWLIGISIYDGNPIKNAVLKPQSSKLKNPIWRLENIVSNEKWLSCDYGLNNVKLIKRLRDNSTECTAISTGSYRDRNLKIQLTCH